MELAPRITEVEVALAIRDLPTNKAAGPDLVPNEVFKNCPPIVPELTQLYNNMLQLECVPEAASKFYVIPLDKPGKDPGKCANGRPIFLLRQFMKLR